MGVYVTKVLDLTQFGLYKISDAIFTGDLDAGIRAEVSFDAGATFQPVDINREFKPKNSKGKVVVRLTFPKTSDPYTIRTSGYFQNLEVGTEVFFSSVNFSTSTRVGENGFYTVFLRKGLYSVYYILNEKRETILSSFNPEISVTHITQQQDKESRVEGFLRDVEWAEYAVFDTFSSQDKIRQDLSTAYISPDGNLTDGESSAKGRYWALAFR